MKRLAEGRRIALGASRLRGVLELVVWLATAAVVVFAAAAAGPAGAAGWFVAIVLLLALSPYAVKSLRIVTDRGRLVADRDRGAFLRDGAVLVAFDDTAALHSRMVNATCEEFELSVECRDGRRIVLYEGEPTNANYRVIESMARLAGVPFHHRLQ